MEAPRGWDDAAARSPSGHVMQSSIWAAVRERQGWRAEYVRVGDDLPVALVLEGRARVPAHRVRPPVP